jgi:hypothetical protein
MHTERVMRGSIAGVESAGHAVAVK